MVHSGRSDEERRRIAEERRRVEQAGEPAGPDRERKHGEAADKGLGPDREAIRNARRRLEDN